MYNQEVINSTLEKQTESEHTLIVSTLGGDIPNIDEHLL